MIESATLERKIIAAKMMNKRFAILFGKALIHVQRHFTTVLKDKVLFLLCCVRTKAVDNKPPKRKRSLV